MKKLRLSLDELNVDTFRIQEPEYRAGTVAAHDSAGEQPADAAAITGWSWLCGSCNATCDGGSTCPLSCGGPAPTGCNSPYCQNHPTTVPITKITDANAEFQAY
jgi:hypothetical protein